MYYSIAYMENDRVYFVLGQGDSIQDVTASFQARNVDTGRIVVSVWERPDFVPVDMVVDTADDLVSDDDRAIIRKEDEQWEQNPYAVLSATPKKWRKSLRRKKANPRTISLSS